jgi:glycerophosphoryl diester phosphodiesterase
VSAASPEGPTAPAHRTLRLAHRGDWRVAPENTLAALTAAMAIPGCDGVELDVRLAGDRVPIVLHDATFHRVHGRPERADEVDSAVIAELGIPTLAAALASLPQDAYLDIELKGDAHGDATADVLRAARGEAPTRAAVSSFDVPSLAAMAERLPGWTLWLNAMDLAPTTQSLALGLGCRGISVMWGAITPAHFRAARAAGLDVVAWTVRRRATFDRLERMGVLACCVEGPALDGGAR